MDGSNTEEPPTSWQFKPGDTVTPGGQPAQTPDTSTVEPTSPPQENETSGEEPAAQTPQPRMQSNDNSISWTASEFIAHNKSPAWYGVVLACTAVVAAAVYFLTRDKISTAVVVVGAIVFAAYAARTPKQIGYRLDEAGLAVGSRYHALDEFRSFFVVQEGAFSSVTFLPLKRFAPLLTIYYDPQDEEKIISLLSGQLPMDKRGHDVVDNFMRRIRF